MAYSDFKTVENVKDKFNSFLLCTGQKVGILPRIVREATSPQVSVDSGSVLKKSLFQHRPE